MGRNNAGKIDLGAIASLLAAIASLAAVVTAGLVAWQVRETREAARVSTRFEILWHLNDQWNSPGMVDVRSAAAVALLSGKPGGEVGAVLDFFEELALLMDRGTVDEEVAALYFYWPLANYWAASNAYVQQVQRDQPSAWDDVGGLANRLSAVQARRKRRPPGDVIPSAGQVQQFLLGEQGDSECSEDTEVRKTPA
jgi:hypothetical protein